MRRIMTLCFGLACGGAVMWFAFNFHLVKSDSEWVTARKESAGLSDFYVDISSWDSAEWDDHPQLQANLRKAGHGDLVPAPPIEPEQVLQDALDLWKSARRVIEERTE